MRMNIHSSQSCSGKGKTECTVPMTLFPGSTFRIINQRPLMAAFMATRIWFQSCLSKWSLNKQIEKPRAGGRGRCGQPGSRRECGRRRCAPTGRVTAPRAAASEDPPAPPWARGATPHQSSDTARHGIGWRPPCNAAAPGLRRDIPAEVAVHHHLWGERFFFAPRQRTMTHQLVHRNPKKSHCEGVHRAYTLSWNKRGE